MDLNIKLDLTIGEGEAKKEIALTYDEAKELFTKLQELFHGPIYTKIDGYFKDLKWPFM